jgi:predicted nicotinamide N-methyase
LRPSPVDIILADTFLGAVPFVPEVMLHQATNVVAEEWVANSGAARATPYWAFPWPGGQALSRYLLDHPERVRGKRVLDFASGSGLIGIAAAKAGAAKVLAFDIDPMAKAATRLNAEINDVKVEELRKVSMEKPFNKADIIVTGDVCYNQAMTTRIMRWLYLCVDRGIPVLLGDPGRAYVPKSGLKEIARYEVPVRRELEECDTRAAMVWEVNLPDL